MCQRKALGGKAIVGPRKLMEVSVAGRVWPFGNGNINTALLDDSDDVA